MPNIIELNLLNNKSIVATMQGTPLANENSYKIIAGEENATKFIIKSIPEQYQTARLTVEMVNSQGLGIAERELSEIEVDLVSYKGFILPVGMAVAGYGYVSIKAYLDNSTTKENDIIQVREKVVFQPLKLKVWNTIPQWQDYVDKTANVKVVDGYLILTENGNEYNLGYVQGEKGEKGDSGGEVDSTLSVEGAAADAKATGDALSGKIDKISATTQRHQVYGKLADGSQKMINMGHYNQTDAIPRFAPASTSEVGSYDYGATIAVSTPQQPYQAANKKFVEDYLSYDGYVHYVNTTGYEVCPTIKNDNTYSYKVFSTYAVDGSIAVRDGGGALRANTNNNNVHNLVNIKFLQTYVSNAVENATGGTLYKHDLTIWNMLSNTTGLCFSFYSKINSEITTLQDLKLCMTVDARRLFGYNTVERGMAMLCYDDYEDKFYLNEIEADVNEEEEISFEDYVYEN